MRKWGLDGIQKMEREISVFPYLKFTTLIKDQFLKGAAGVSTACVQNSRLYQKPTLTTIRTKYATTWMDAEIIRLSEMNQTEYVKATNKKTIKLIETDKVVTRGKGKG